MLKQASSSTPVLLFATFATLITLAIGWPLWPFQRDALVRLLGDLLTVGSPISAFQALTITVLLAGERRGTFERLTLYRTTIAGLVASFASLGFAILARALIPTSHVGNAPSGVQFLGVLAIFSLVFSCITTVAIIYSEATRGDS